MVKRKKVSKNKNIILRVALLAFAVYMVYSMITLQAQLSESKKELQAKQSEISALKVSNDELSDLLKNGSKNDLIERAARDKLDFVYENEEVYEDVSGK